MKKIILGFIISLIALYLPAQNENISNGQYFDGEPYMIIDPHNGNHIVVAWMGYTVGSPFGIKVKVSNDGGTSWGASTFLPHQATIFHSADVSLAFDTAGYLWACYIDFSEAPDSGAIYVVRSSDGGTTWGTPSKVMDAFDDGAQIPIDRPWFTINPVTNHFYVTSKPAPWILPPCRPYFRTSANAGATWAPWRYIDTAGFLVGSLISAPMAAPAVGSDGVFHCVYPSYLSSQNILPGYIHASSANDGVSFSYHGKYMLTTASTDTLPKVGYNLAVDPSNPQHLAFNFTAKLQHNDLDIWVDQSTDGGSTWTTPVRVNDDPVNNGVMQDLTWSHFDVNGDLIVGWRDRRDAPAPDTGYSVPSEIWGAILRKDSANFSHNFKISDTLAQFNGTYLDHPGNDFMNIALHNDTVYAVWGDVRTNVLSVWFYKKGASSALSTGILLTDDAIPAVSVYPNPTKDVLYISGEKVTEVEITDMTGKKVYDQRINEQKVSITSLTSGTYMIRLITSHGIATQRFVKD